MGARWISEGLLVRRSACDGNTNASHVNSTTVHAHHACDGIPDDSPRSCQTLGNSVDTPYDVVRTSDRLSRDLTTRVSTGAVHQDLSSSTEGRFCSRPIRCAHCGHLIWM